MRKTSEGTYVSEFLFLLLVGICRCLLANTAVFQALRRLSLTNICGFKLYKRLLLVLHPFNKILHVADTVERYNSRNIRENIIILLPIKLLKFRRRTLVVYVNKSSYKSLHFGRLFL